MPETESFLVCCCRYGVLQRLLMGSIFWMFEHVDAVPPEWFWSRESSDCSLSAPHGGWWWAGSSGLTTLGEHWIKRIKKGSSNVNIKQTWNRDKKKKTGHKNRINKHRIENQKKTTQSYHIKDYCSVKQRASWNPSTSGSLLGRVLLWRLLTYFTGCVLTSLTRALLSTAGHHSHYHLHRSSLTANKPGNH